MWDRPLNLADAKRRIEALIEELRRQSAAVAAAGQSMAGPSGHLPGHPYHSRADQYGVGVAGYGGSHPSDAYQAVAGPLARVEGIKQELLGIQGKLRTRLGDWDHDLEELQREGRHIRQVQDVSGLYGRAQDAAYREKTQIVNLMNAISVALDRAQQTVGAHAGHAGRRTGRTIDQIAGHGSDLYRGGITDRYGLPILDYVLPLLDKGRYGAATLQSIVQYPTPRLRQASSDRTETLWDKVVRGLGYVDRQGGRACRVELPAYYYEICPTGHVPEGEYQIRP